MNFILKAENVVKRFGQHTALDKVSISVPEKSIFGLLGPNGAGKTTLIRIINQITGPDEGQILFEDRLLDTTHSAQIGYLPEERGLYKKMAVGEQALYLAQLRGLSKKEAKQRLTEWFERFGMQDWWKKKIEELSKGMQQKVQFIVTVLHEPQLLILDEPFSGFDPINSRLIKDEILRLREKGSTIILSTHNMGTVEDLCDNIALINKSKKILDGSVHDLQRSYGTNVYEIVFRGTPMAFTHAMWTGAELISQTEEKGFFRVRVKLLRKTSPNDLLSAVLNVAEIHSFREILPTMDDIFIQAVQSQEGIRTETGGGSRFTE